MERLNVAIDAMGGDFAPANEVAGGLQAPRQSGNSFHLTFVGDESAIRQELAKHQHEGLSFSVVHASQVITMHDAPTAALKQKKDSSLAIAMDLHKQGKADACVSAGNTGAVLSASTLILGRIKGVSRPTIGTFFPTESGFCLVVDAGANVDSRPQHLFEFGVMGSIYMKLMYGKENPSIGLLNVGEEETKGNEVALETHKRFKNHPINFKGNIEGRDILKGTTDVVVCDGFVGNIILKFGESVPNFLKAKLKAYAKRSFWNLLMIAMMRGPLRAALKDMDYEEYGGVPVLGVNGVSIIGHGSSSPKAIKNMVLKAVETAKRKVNTEILDALARQANASVTSKQ